MKAQKIFEQTLETEAYPHLQDGTKCQNSKSI